MGQQVEDLRAPPPAPFYDLFSMKASSSSEQHSSVPSLLSLGCDPGKYDILCSGKEHCLQRLLIGQNTLHRTNIINTILQEGVQVSTYLQRGPFSDLQALAH